MSPQTSLQLFDSSKYLHIPYVDRGRDENGVDCWGMARLIFRNEFSIELPSYTEEYASEKELKEISATINRHRLDWREIPKGEEVCGDLIILRIHGYPLHIGVVITRGIMIHTLKGCGTCIEKYDSRMWKNRIFGFIRHKERMNER